MFVAISVQRIFSFTPHGLSQDEVLKMAFSLSLEALRHKPLIFMALIIGLFEPQLLLLLIL